MTLESFAELLDARQTGPNRWQARCPAHSPDRHPSLSIRQGDRGVLLKCWAGCSTDAVLKALGSTMPALFDAPLTPEQRREAAQRSRERDAKARALHHAGVARNRQLLRLESLRDAIGAKLARNPDDRELGRLFHLACDRLHEAEATMPHHEDGPHGQEPAPETPVAIADALYQIGANFNAKETARSTRAA